MAAPIFLPPIIRGMIKCRRCGHQYAKKKPVCPHCAHLSDREVAELRDRRAEELEATARLGGVFLLIALGLAALLLLLVFG